MIFQWRPGFPSRGVKAKVAREEVERVRARHGGHLSPANIVEAARKGGSPIRRLFEWDDTKAARAHRLQQAREMMSAIIVVESEGDSPAHEYSSIRVGKANAYVSTREAMKDTERRKQILDNALEDLRSWHLRYSVYRECAGMACDVSLVLSKFQRKRKAG